MANGSRRAHGSDEYIFVDGRAMRADEVVRIDLDSTSVPGQAEAAVVPGQPVSEQSTGQSKRPSKAKKSSAREALARMEADDAFALRDDAAEGLISFGQAKSLMAEDARKLRAKCLAFGVALAVVTLFALCISGSYSWRIYSPLEVIDSFGRWFSMMFSQITGSSSYADIRASYIATVYAPDIMAHSLTVLKYLLCGAILAVAGMLYQNAFRNPIAAPSMLGVSSGINLVLVLMVLAFGSNVYAHLEIYYLGSYAAGILTLILVLLGGKWISGKGQFNVVNMILIGTILSQLMGVITTYVQNVTMNSDTWLVYYNMQAAVGVESIYTWISVIVGAIAAFIPIFLFRFKLNLISFSDAETKLLGVNPNKLRILALSCGSLMVLTAQINTGQVAMASLVVPFVVRAVFGAEFRKQLAGNILVGALLILVCGCISDYVLIWGTTVDLGSIVSIIAMPLFVWMLSVRQRSWE